MSELARWLPLDKAAGQTSHDLVARARKRLGLRRIGHTGTLDPDATGVLVLALGKATRLIQYLPGGKAYRAVIRLGVTTDSYDMTGQIIAEAPVPTLDEADLRVELAAFLGPQQQIPPMVSAISIGGKRLYELARQGIEIERPPRDVIFHSIELLSWDSPLLTIDVACSAGTYIRSLAHDLGQRLGCGASLASLQRTRAHAFGLEVCIAAEAMLPLSESAEQGLPADWPLQHLPAIRLSTPAELRRLRMGQSLSQSLTQSLTQSPMADVSQSDVASPEASAQDRELVRIYAPDGEFAAIGQRSGERIQPKLLLLDPILEKAADTSPAQTPEP